MADWRESEWNHFCTRARQTRASDEGSNPMNLLRELIHALRDQARAATLHPPNRPTSLFEAGSVGGAGGAGGAGGRGAPAPRPRDATQGDQYAHRNLFPESPAPTGEAPRRNRAEAVAGRPPTNSRAALRATLRSPASLRT